MSSTTEALISHTNEHFEYIAKCKGGERLTRLLSFERFLRRHPLTERIYLELASDFANAVSSFDRFCHAEHLTISTVAEKLAPLVDARKSENDPNGIYALISSALGEGRSLDPEWSHPRVRMFESDFTKESRALARMVTLAQRHYDDCPEVYSTIRAAERRHENEWKRLSNRFSLSPEYGAALLYSLSLVADGVDLDLQHDEESFIRGAFYWSLYDVMKVGAANHEQSEYERSFQAVLTLAETLKMRVVEKLALEPNLEPDFAIRSIRRVENLVRAYAPALEEKLQSVAEDLRSMNPEKWSNAVHSCRRIIETLADAVHPPGPSRLGADGKEREMDQAHYLNRLLAFVDDNSDSETFKSLVGASLKSFIERLEALYRAANKGSHTRLTAIDEADRYVAHTIMLVGDILTLKVATESTAKPRV